MRDLPTCATINDGIRPCCAYTIVEMHRLGAIGKEVKDERKNR